jgi:hypothetical protein
VESEEVVGTLQMTSVASRPWRLVAKSGQIKGDRREVDSLEDDNRFNRNPRFHVIKIKSPITHFVSAGVNSKASGPRMETQEESKK